MDGKLLKNAQMLYQIKLNLVRGHLVRGTHFIPSGWHLAENKLFWNSRQWFQVERNFLGRLQFCTFEITFFEIVWNEDTPFSAQCTNTADNGVF